MGLTKQTVTDKIETIRKDGDYYILQCREAKQVLEDNTIIAQNFHRYVLEPDYDVSNITDPIVKAQFQAVMTDTTKANYAKFLEDQKKAQGGE